MDIYSFESKISGDDNVKAVYDLMERDDSVAISTKMLGKARVRLVTRVPFYCVLLANMRFIPSLTVTSMTSTGMSMYYNPYWVAGLPKSSHEEYIQSRRSITNLMNVLNGVDIGSKAYISAREEMIKKELADISAPKSDAMVMFAMVRAVLAVAFEHARRKADRIEAHWIRASNITLNMILVDDKIGTVPTEFEVNKEYEKLTTEEVYDRLEKPPTIMYDVIGDVSDSANDGFRESLLSAAASFGAGNTPLGLRLMIQKMTDPKIDWRQYLIKSLRGMLKHDMSYQKLSRRCRSAYTPGNSINGSTPTRIMMPGMVTDDKIDVYVFFDMSGSTGGMRDKFFGELYGMLQQFPDYKAHVGCFDTEVYNVQEFEDENPDSVFGKYEPQGDGGTMFESVFEWLKENEIVPSQLIVFTDGYPCGSWGDEDYCNTLWMVVGDPNIVAPFGVTVTYEEE